MVGRESDVSARGGFGLMGRYGSVYIARPSIRNKFHWDNGLPKRGRTAQPDSSVGRLNLDRFRNCCVPFRFVILTVPFFGAGGPMQPCRMRSETAQVLRPAKSAGHEDDTVADDIKSYSGLEIGVGPRPIVCNGPS